MKIQFPLNFTTITYALILLLVLSSTLARSDDMEIPLKDWRIERQQFEALLIDGAEMSINNPFGDIRVRTSNDNEVLIVAMVQRHISDEWQPEIRITSKADAMDISVHYPEPEPENGNINENFRLKRRVDVSVLAPGDAPMSITTRHGRAESKGHSGGLLVRSITGSIIIVTKGKLDAKSERGSVQATFQSRDWTTSSVLETTTGDIEVLLMEHPGVRVELETAGAITTDYSIEIESRPGSSHKNAVARIGDASENLTINSIRGAITLNRIFDMIHTEKKITLQQGGTEIQ